MGRRWIARGLCGERYCGNMGNKEVHDLDHEDTACNIEDIIHRHEVVAFRTMDCAHDQGYHDCPYCLGKSVEQKPQI